ncbi:MAG: hypothetical protein J6V55_07810 [Alistipes sp.]|nr:hypothetical protein [Alistipes sp.]
MKWLDAIIKVLQNNKTESGDFEPMHYVDITNAIIDGNLRQKFGSTPQNTVNANITTHPNLFNSLGLGLYGLTEEGQKYAIKVIESQQIDVEQHVDVDELDDTQEAINIEIEKENKSKIIKIFGMFWDRTKINWADGKMEGQQNSKSDPLDFTNVRGIYLLYDGREVVYVGQALDSSILKRLKDHTRDRLSGRWNRFSWFGIDGINPDGSIAKTEDVFNVNLGDLINSLEGILIEGLEPRQNRKQGNKFGDEYIQVIDYEIQKEQALKVCIDLLGKK